MSELRGKTYLVTGASSGIGRAVCLALARQGANVALLARNAERLEETRGLMAPGRHAVIPFDLRDSGALRGCLGELFTEYGALDGCVYCAGVGKWAKLRDTSHEDLLHLMQVNCFSFIETTKMLMYYKKKAHPMRVVAISSISSISNEKYYVAYSTSKAALEASIRSMSIELISKNTTINAIRPAFVDTPMISCMNDIMEDFDTRIRANGYQPQGLIAPEDVARMALFLLGDGGRFITGAVLPINGGAAC